MREYADGRGRKGGDDEKGVFRGGKKNKRENGLDVVRLYVE